MVRFIRLVTSARGNNETYVLVFVSTVAKKGFVKCLKKSKLKN